MQHINPNHTKGIKTSRKELIDLAKSWLILGIAFGIAMNGLKFDSTMIIAICISWITIGVGFVFHELAHKFVAQHYGHFAEFRSFDHMLIIALIFSFFGFIFAAPGAVMIHGRLTRKQNGIISAAGPAMNLIAAVLFFVIAMSYSGVLQIIGQYGFTINSWLAMFNLIPVGFFDGKKIFDWNKPAYITLAILSLLFVFGPRFF